MRPSPEPPIFYEIGKRSMHLGLPLQGVLAGAAWFGFLRLPKFGLYQILEAIGEEGAGPGTILAPFG
jgi:hypothetical protein